MSTFELDRLDACILNQIVQKFTFRSGATFYRSCRGAKDFVDRIKPVWDLPESRLAYKQGKRSLSDGQREWRQVERRSSRKRRSTDDTIDFPPLKFCKIARVDVNDCRPKFFRSVVLPELSALGAVEKLRLDQPTKLSDEDLCQLVSSVKADTVQIWDEHFDPTSDVFKNVKNLGVVVAENKLKTYWTTTMLFELARNRSAITLYSHQFSAEMFSNFVKNWLKGHSTGSLERLTVITRDASLFCKGVEAIVDHPDIQNLCNSERDLSQLGISLDHDFCCDISQVNIYFL